MKVIIAFPQIGDNFTPNGCKRTEDIYLSPLNKAQLNPDQPITRVAYDYDKGDSAMSLLFAVNRFPVPKTNIQNYPVDTEENITLQKLSNGVDNNSCVVFVAEPWYIQELAHRAGHEIEPPDYGENGKFDAIRFDIDGDNVNTTVLTTKTK